MYFLCFKHTGPLLALETYTLRRKGFPADVKYIYTSERKKDNSHNKIGKPQQGNMAA